MPRPSSRISHHNEKLEWALEHPGWQDVVIGPPPPATPDGHKSSPPSASNPSEGYAVLGLGQAMLDFAATVDDDFLEQLGIPKGGRK